MLDSSGNLIHRFTSGQTVYEVEGAVEMVHSLGDTLTHAAGDVKYHVEGDLQYLKLGATKYHKVGDEVHQKDGDILYHDIGDNETHKAGDQMFFEEDTDVNGDAYEHGGSAYVYRTNGGSTQRVELLAPAEINDGDKFGEQVAIAGNQAFAYAEGEDKIYVYNGVNSATGTLAHSDVIDTTGMNVSHIKAFQDGGTVYLGVSDVTGTGSVTTYRSSNGFNAPHQTFTGENDGDRFGESFTFHKKWFHW